jgi:adenine-specific DNA-methyltransferase
MDYAGTADRSLATMPASVAMLEAGRIGKPRAADHAFRCVSGSVAVSAYELEALPLPPPDETIELHKLVQLKADRQRIDVECARLYF